MVNVDTSDTADVPAAQKAAADRRLEANKDAKDRKDAAEKAAKQKAEDEQRQRDCERARLSVQGLESGQIRYRMGSGGEREALDGSARDAEIANARRAMDAACSPRKPAPAGSASPK